MQFVIWICFLFGKISKNTSWDWYAVLQTHKYFWTGDTEIGGLFPCFFLPFTHIQLADPEPYYFCWPVCVCVCVVLCLNSICADIHDIAQSHHFKPDLLFFIFVLLRLFTCCGRKQRTNNENVNRHEAGKDHREVSHRSASSQKHWAESNLVVWL